MGIGLGGIKVPGAVQASPTSNNKPPELPAEYYAQLQEMSRVKKLVNAYKAAPHSYSEGEALQIQQLAVGAGIPMEIESSAGARWMKGLLSMVDTATLGILVPNDLYTPVNDAERKAVSMGSMAGMLVPWGGPFRLAGAAAKGIKGLTGAAKVAKNPAMKSLMQGLTNPFGVGKVLPGFSGAATKTAAKTAVKEAPRIGKNFGKGMNSIIKQDKNGFWKVVNAAKTPAAKRKAAKDWIFRNMNQADRAGKGMGPRVEGWLKKKFPDKVKKKAVTPKVKALQPGPKPLQIGSGSAGGTNAGGNVIIAGPGSSAAGQSAATKKVIAANKARKLKKGRYDTSKAKDAEFEVIDTGAKQTKKGAVTMDSIKEKIKGKSKIINSKKIKTGPGNVRKVVRLNQSERAYLTSKMSPKVRSRMRKIKKGPARDHAILRWAKTAGLV